MILWLWAVRLIKGFALVDGARIGKVIWIMVWIVIALTAYHKLFFSKQSVTKIEKIEKQYVYQDCPDKNKFIGLKLWKFGLGLNF